MGTSVGTRLFSIRGVASCLLVAIFFSTTLEAAVPDVAIAQEHGESDAEADTIRDHYLDDRDALMVTLGAWAIGSMASGAALWAGAGNDGERRAVGIQYVAWGGVNLVLAAIALIRSPIQRDDHESAAYWRDERSSLRTIFWWNAGLDLLYVTTGILMYALGRAPWVRGTGAGILVQGAWLAIFDFTSALFVGARDI